MIFPMFYPPFTEQIGAHTSLIVQYKGVQEYNFLYCTISPSDHSLKVSWKLKGKQMTENFVSGFILDAGRADSKGSILIKNTRTAKTILHCEYKFEPPKLHFL